MILTLSALSSRLGPLSSQVAHHMGSIAAVRLLSRFTAFQDSALTGSCLPDNKLSGTSFHKRFRITPDAPRRHRAGWFHSLCAHRTHRIASGLWTLPHWSGIHHFRPLVFGRHSSLSAVLVLRTRLFVIWTRISSPVRLTQFSLTASFSPYICRSGLWLLLYSAIFVTAYSSPTFFLSYS